MKYIRMKDGRVFYAKKKSKKDVELANDNLHWEAIPKGCNDYFTLDYEDDEIIKIADAIDELIDGLIVEEKGNPNNWFIMEVDEFKNEEERLKNWTYRAFIKTDKGLIYVAKMSERGRLELL